MDRLEQLVSDAYQQDASDIHIESLEHAVRIRIRVDGMLLEHQILDVDEGAQLMIKIKVISKVNIAEKRIPQDGHFVMKLEQTVLNVRVAVMPTVYGEKVVMRLLSKKSPIDEEVHFGMQPDSYEKVKCMIQAPYGLIYITGPTGSGKTTTLYEMLRLLKQQNVNVSTIEDPIERRIEGVNQTQVNQVAGLTFEVGLRGLLRQDPDIIMVGETRDLETAQISARAAITGHLVLSTLHTNHAASAITRLKDMGLESYVIADSLVGIIAQRLVRKVCNHCSIEVEVPKVEQDFFGGKIRMVKQAVGCQFCNQTGYLGRIAIHEVLEVDKNMRELIFSNATTEEIKDYAVSRQKMITLKQAGANLVEKGITTIEEWKRVTYYEWDES